MNHHKRRLAAGLTIVLSAVVLAPFTASAANAAGTPASAPRALTVSRDIKNPNDLLVKWAAPATSGSSKLDRYDVSVVTDGKANVTVVPATQTSLEVPGKSLSSMYRIKVASRNTEHLGTETGSTTVWPAVPNAPTKISGGRVQGDPSTVVVSWAAPSRSGYSDVNGYVVTLKQVSNGATWTQKTTGTEAKFGNLSIGRTYLVTVQAANAEGTGIDGKFYVGNNQPSTPGAVTAVRDPQDPTRVKLAWGAPAYSGIGKVTGYQVGLKAKDGTVAWGAVLPAATLTATVELDIKSDADFTVRALNGDVASYKSAAKHVVKVGAATPVVPATAALPVVIAADGSVVTVNLVGSLPAGMTGVDMTLEPSVATTFSDHTSAPVDTKQMFFGNVPDGIYLVTVRGLSPKGATVLKSGYVTIGHIGELGAGDWQVVRGSATISGQTVDIVKSGEVRVLDTRNSPTEDATVTTTATLHNGSGYGLWTRASHNADGTDSGYSFQVDPGYGNEFIVRDWSHDKECSQPLARTAFPKGFDGLKSHLVKVSVHGDSYVATVDGVDEITIPSISKTVAGSSCNYLPLNHGTRVGMRSWGTSSSTFVGTTLTK